MRGRSSGKQEPAPREVDAELVVSGYPPGASRRSKLRFHRAQDKEPGEANTNDPETLVNQSGQRVLTFGRNNFSPRETTIKRFQIADTVTWIRGTHSLKTGFDVNFDNMILGEAT